MKNTNMWLVALVLLLNGCGESPVQQAQAKNPMPQKLAEAPPSSHPRMDQLLKNWANAGLKVELRKTNQSDIINRMYGCINYITCPGFNTNTHLHLAEESVTR